MASASFWQSFVWTRFATPSCDRSLFSRIQKTRPQRIVEFGIRDLQRTERCIALAQRFLQPTDGGSEAVRYCGIDLFEARRQPTPLNLKTAHNQLARTKAKIRLVPGQLSSALARTANVLPNTDLLIVDAMHSREELEAIFHFLPRMLHAQTSIARYSEESGRPRLRWMKPDSFVTPRSRSKAA